MGRLIDADKLKQHYSWWGGLIGDDYVSELVEQKKVFDTIVDVQPTVDAVPTEFHDKCMEMEIEKRFELELKNHGHWAKDMSGYWCSVCNAYFADVEYGYEYCPHCGAKMDEVEDAETD